MPALAVKGVFPRLLAAAALFLLAVGPAIVKGATIEREPAFRDNLYDVEVRGDRVWIVGYYGTILHSQDRGHSWELQQGGMREALYRVVFIDDRKGWISGSYGAVLHTKDGGKSWKTQPTPVEEHLFGLYLHDERQGWAVGSRGTVLATDDGGGSWINRPVGEDVILNDIRFTDNRRGWIVGEFGRIYQSRDGGRTWVKQQSPIEVSFVSGESRNLFRLLFADSEGGWAFGLDGVILKTRNGTRWAAHHPDGAGPQKVPRRHLFSAATANGKKWAVGERGTVLFAALRQDYWQVAKLKIPPVSLNGIGFGRDGLGFIVGNRGVILRTEDGGEQWKPIRIIPSARGKGMSQIP